MGATATVAHPVLPVEPGEEAVCAVHVTNSGAVVDSFALDVVGPCRPWSRVEPADVPLFPGQSAEVLVRLAPPRQAGVAPGPVPFAVRVTSREDPDGSVIEEGTLDVAPWTQVGAELVPRTSTARGRGRGRHQLAVDNHGNAPVEVRLSGHDPDDLLDVRFTPSELLVGPGSVAFVRVRPRGRVRAWTGPAVPRPFTVTVDGDGAPVALDGVLVQQPVLPAWTARAVLLGLATLVALAVAWLAVLRPAVQDVARSTAGQATADTRAQARAAQAASDANSRRLDEVSEQLAAGGAGGTRPTPAATPGTRPTPGPSAATAPPPGRPSAAPSPAGDPEGAADQAGSTSGLGEPTAVRLEASGTSVFTVPATQVFSLTDINFENPAGDRGLLTLSRDGTTLLRKRLSHLTDHDLHYIAPLVFPARSSLRMTVSCENEGTSPCTPAVFVNGFVRAEASPSPSP